MTFRKRVTLRAPAKINLHLEVLRQRHDGYHDIETILQAVDLFDTLRVTLVDRYAGGEPKLELLVTPADAAPDTSDNLVLRAVHLFCESQRVSGHLQLELTKEIPVGSGLGGGSSDAMAALMACDRLFGTSLDPDVLCALGARIGSDVPFFLAGGTALGRGRGTELTPLPAIRQGWIYVFMPRYGFSTKEVYDGLKMGLTVRPPVVNIQVIKPLIARFPTSSWPGFNRLEEVVIPAHPELQRAMVKLRQSAPLAMMTGSGSAIYGVFSEQGMAEQMAGMIETSFIYTRCMRPHPAGVEFVEG